MMTIALPRPAVRPLPPIAATLALACAISWFARPAVAPDLFAFLGAAALALAARYLLIRLDAPQPNRAAALIFVLPGAMASAGLQGQCDMLWAAACVMALACAVTRKHVMMLAWCGLALGVSFQTLFIVPFFIALLITRRVPPQRWLVAPLVAAATMLLAWTAGWPAADLLSLPLPQAGSHPALSLDAPNIWQIVQALPIVGALPLGGLALAAAAGVTAAYIAWLSTRPLEGRALLAPALLAPLLTAGLLPHMDGQDFFLADILALVTALALRDRSGWRIAAMVQAGSLLAWFGHRSGFDALAMIGAIPVIMATIEIARPLLHPFANDNPLLARA